MNSYAVFVESQGKVKNVESIFDSLGIHCEVVATQGRLLDLPARVGELSKLLNRRYWEPVNGFKYSQVIKQLKSKNEGFILTDMDREGEWCAYELQRLSDKHNCKLHRISSRDLSFSGIEKSISIHLDIDLSLVAEAISHRLLSRLASNNSESFSIGKVVTPFLSEVSKLKNNKEVLSNKDVSIVPQYALFNMSQNAEETMRFKVTEKIELDLLEDGLSIEDIYTSLVIEDDALPSDIYRSLQEAYVTGVITYPRTSNCSSNSTDGAHDSLTISNIQKALGRHDPILEKVVSLAELKREFPNNIMVTCKANNGMEVKIKANQSLVGSSVKFQSTRVDKEAFSFLALYNAGLGTAASYHHHFKACSKLLGDQNVLSKKGMIALQLATTKFPELLELSTIKEINASLRSCEGNTLSEMVKNRLESATKFLSMNIASIEKEEFRFV